MKKIILLLLLLTAAFSINTKAQAVRDTFGFWGYQDATTANMNTFNAYNMQGIHEVFHWSDLEPSPGVYVWSNVYRVLDSCIQRNIYMTFQVSVGQNAPTWVLDSVGSFVTILTGQTGPYPRYYNPLQDSLYYHLLDSIGEFLASLSPQRLGRIYAWQIAEGSTGDEQPYKGILDTTEGYQSDPYIPQDRFDPAWDTYRKTAWDRAAHCAGFQKVCHSVHLMINTGNDGSNVGYVVGGDSTELNENLYVLNHFSFLPLPVVGKEGMISHYPNFTGMVSYDSRYLLYSRGEMQGYIIHTTHPHKELFSLYCNALTANMRILNGDQTYVNMRESGESQTDPRMSNFYTLMTNSVADAFSVPVYMIDWADTTTYPTSRYGALIDPAKQKQYYNALLSDQQQVQTSNNDPYQAAWLWFKTAKKDINPARVASIDSLFPQAAFGNQQDSTYWNDHVIGGQYDFNKNLRRLNPTQNIIPVYRAGKDTAMLGRYAGKPKLDSTGNSHWKYDINNLLIKTTNSDSVQIQIYYLANGSGGSISLSGVECGELVPFGDTTTVTANTNEWVAKTVVIPNFPFKTEGWDFSLDFAGSVTIGLVQVKNLNRY